MLNPKDLPKGVGLLMQAVASRVLPPSIAQQYGLDLRMMPLTVAALGRTSVGLSRWLGPDGRDFITATMTAWAHHREARAAASAADKAHASAATSEIILA